jgi:hypothetical protein
MFHGLVEPKSQIDDNNLGDVLTQPLHVRKNVYNLSAVLKPSRNLLVAASLRKPLEAFNNIGFFPVTFSCLFCLNYDGPPTPEVLDNYDALIYWLSQVPHDPLLESQVPIYYELVIPRHSDAVARVPPNP